MKDKQLLSVMFSDGTDFREQLLNETLGHVRRKRRVRQCGRALLALAIIAAAAWWSMPRREPFHLPAPARSGLQIVHTRPLSSDYIVTTRPDSVIAITSDRSTVAILDDERLLDLAPGETKMLVWHAPDQAELVIVGP
jgi:hypothetical protein